jgi:eukaryotic-like serine/threonine-protein kinase
VGTSDGNDGQDKPSAHAATAISSPGVTESPAPAAAYGSDRLIGQTIADRYHVISLLGRGGMGTVYVCEHVQLKKRVALKVLSEELRRQPELIVRFLKEARAAAQIGHPNIVDVFDLGELPQGGAFIAMALLEGCDLGSEIDRVHVLPVPRAAHIVAEICRALAAAHSKGIVHRDMKPANVFLSRDPDGREQVKVLDFGIAQIQEPTGDEARLTQTGAIVGTPAFMSPEQGRGERSDHRSDIYAVGCILYNLVTGTMPFEAGTLMGVIAKHLFDPVVPPSERLPEAGIPPELDAVVVRAMAKDPAQRFQTMKEMWTALETFISDSPQRWPDPNSGQFIRHETPASLLRAGATPISMVPGASQTMAPPGRSRAALFVGAALVTITVSMSAWYFLMPHAPHGPVPVIPAAPMPTPALAPQPSDITVEVRSTPSHALVFEGDKQVGTTPLHLLRARSNGAIALRVSAEGYEDESIDVSYERDRLIDLRLRPAAPVTKLAPATKTAPHTPTSDRPRPAVKKTGHDGQLKDPFAQ